MNKLRWPEKMVLNPEHTLESSGVLPKINLCDSVPESDLKAPQNIWTYGQGWESMTLNNRI